MAIVRVGSQPNWYCRHCHPLGDIDNMSLPQVSCHRSCGSCVVSAFRIGVRHPLLDVSMHPSKVRTLSGQSIYLIYSSLLLSPVARQRRDQKHKVRADRVWVGHRWFEAPYSWRQACRWICRNTSRVAAWSPRSGTCHLRGRVPIRPSSTLNLPTTFRWGWRCGAHASRTIEYANLDKQFAKISNTIKLLLLDYAEEVGGSEHNPRKYSWLLA